MHIKIIKFPCYISVAEMKKLTKQLERLGNSGTWGEQRLEMNRKINSFPITGLPQ